MGTSRFTMPDTYIIIVVVVFIAAALTYIVPAGRFTLAYEIHGPGGEVLLQVAEGESGEKRAGLDVFGLDATNRDEVLWLINGERVATLATGKPRSLTTRHPRLETLRVVQVYGDYQRGEGSGGVALFARGGEAGLLNFLFEGLVKGNKWGAAVGVVAFILIVGGSFGIILRTQTMEAGIRVILRRFRRAELVLIPLLFLLFSFAGAIFGMSEEAIPFAMIVVPILVAMGYDAVVGILVTYGATQVGFATSWMNPFSVAIAQSIAGVPAYSGAGFRIAMFAALTTLGTVLTLLYAWWIKRHPERSVAYASDSVFRAELDASASEPIPFGRGHGLVLLVVGAGCVWIIWGVQAHGYHIPEIASIFFTMGLAAGVVAVVFGLNQMRLNTIAEAFRDGAKDLVGAALVVGMAQGVVVVLGHHDAASDSVLNTLLHGTAALLAGVDGALAAWLMFVFQSVFNFFVVSGSGQAALTMPLLAPLAQLLALPKDVAVLAFQLGDGLTNLIVPTSGCLMGVLGVARLEWSQWLRFQVWVQLLLFILGSIFVIAGVAWL